MKTQIILLLFSVCSTTTPVDICILTWFRKAVVYSEIIFVYIEAYLTKSLQAASSICPRLYGTCLVIHRTNCGFQSKWVLDVKFFSTVRVTFLVLYVSLPSRSNPLILSCRALCVSTLYHLDCWAQHYFCYLLWRSLQWKLVFPCKLLCLCNAKIWGF